jgi:hypothetical protein
MVTLKNVIIINDVIQCEFYSESDSEHLGFVSVDVNTKEVIKQIPPKGSEIYSGINHVINTLIEIIDVKADIKKIPKEFPILWY